MSTSYRLLACLLVWLLAASATLAVDRIKLIQGSQQAGTITGMSATQVHLTVGSTKREVPVNEIDTITFDSEPNELTQARNVLRAGRYEDAAAMLAKIAPAAMKRPEIARDVEYYRALAAARLALSGKGAIAEAGKRMFAFEKAGRDNFHYFEACETLGDLLVALGNYSAAEDFYQKLAGAPWRDYQMRAGVLIGRTLVRQHQYDRAAAKFDEVLATDAEGKLADTQKVAAMLGKASALSGAGKTDDAVRTVEEVIAKADPEDEELYARAYNILGDCQQAAGKTKAAIVSYLHVDLLYSRYAEQHAEALANLARLFAADDKAERATEARGRLKQKYPDSVWASK